MHVENGTIEGDLRLDYALCLQGMATGDIDVLDGAALELRGMCCGQLRVHGGGEASVHGMVLKGLVNHGGQITVYGIVEGGVHTVNGQTKIDPAAVVHQQVEDEDVLELLPCEIGLLQLIGTKQVLYEDAAEQYEKQVKYPDHRYNFEKVERKLFNQGLIGHADGSGILYLVGPALRAANDGQL